MTLEGSRTMHDASSLAVRMDYCYKAVYNSRLQRDTSKRHKQAVEEEGKCMICEGQDSPDTRRWLGTEYIVVVSIKFIIIGFRGRSVDTSYDDVSPSHHQWTIQSGREGAALKLGPPQRVTCPGFHRIHLEGREDPSTSIIVGLSMN